MLSFHISDAGHKVNIICDAQGMATLLGTLAKLVGERASHAHLWAASATGGHLNEKTPWGDEAVSEVIIDYQEGDR